MLHYQTYKSFVDDFCFKTLAVSHNCGQVKHAGVGAELGFHRQNCNKAQLLYVAFASAAAFKTC